MITITPIDSGCRVQASESTFLVFPASKDKDMWSLLSHPEEDLAEEKRISWPGEYDFQGVTLRAIGQQEGKQVSYAAIIDGVRFAFVDAPVLEWEDSAVEKLGGVDVLVVAAENPKKVLALLEAVDPRIVILRPVSGGDTAGVAKACGQSSITPVSEFKVKPGSLPQDSRQVVVLG